MCTAFNSSGAHLSVARMLDKPSNEMNSTLIGGLHDLNTTLFQQYGQES